MHFLWWLRLTNNLQAELNALRWFGLADAVCLVQIHK